MNRTIAVLLLATLSAFPVFSQSKEQREAAKQWPLSFRVTPGKGESRMYRDKNKSKNNNSRNKTQVKIQEKTMCWTAKVSISSTNFTEKVAIKAIYVGTSDDELAILGSDTLPVQLDEKGRAVVEIKSPVAKLTTTMKTTGGRRSRTTKESSGDRMNGLIAQLTVNNKIVKTFVSQPSWAKAAWNASIGVDDLRPGAQNKK